MTIKEIANSLGVSTATVSNVIHGPSGKNVAGNGAAHPKKAGAVSVYPQYGARMLAKGDSEIVGVITNYPNREEKLALPIPLSAK